MKRQIVVFSATASDQAGFAKHFEHLPDVELRTEAQPLSDETVKQAADAEVVAVFVTDRLDKPMLDKLPKLKMVACRATGFDNVDLAEAKRRGIVVCNVPSYGENTVAEFAVLLMLAVMRRITAQFDAIQQTHIDHPALTGHDLHGKTLGVVGTGRIGRHVLKIAKGFEMETLAYDVYPNEPSAAELGFAYVDLPELLGRSDIVTLHAPATKGTQQLINAAAFKQMKAGAILINTARGNLVDTAALIEALRSGHLSGAGLDVLEGETFLDVDDEFALLTGKHPDHDMQFALQVELLKKLPNVVVTPHNAFNTAEAIERILNTSIDNVDKYLTGTPQNLVKPA